MEYNEQLAKEIVAKHQLRDNLVFLWKVRGSIPDKYADPDFEKRKSLDKKGQVLQDRIVQLVKNEKLNTTFLCELAGVSKHTVRDIGRKEYNLSEQSLVALRKALNQIRTETKKVVEAQQDRTRYDDRDRQQLVDLINKGYFWKHYLTKFDQTDKARLYFACTNPEKLNYLNASMHKRLIDALAVFLIETAN